MSGFARSAVSYAMPLAALVMAVAVRASGLSVNQDSLNIRILIGALSSAIMFATIFVVLDHAEAVARRVGEPYGTLVLTIAVTAIEVSIIVSMMLLSALLTMLLIPALVMLGRRWLVA